MLRAGRPVLFVEQQGKRLTAPTSASAGDLTQAARLLPNMLRPLRKGHRKLCVTHWNSEPVRNTPGKEYLEAAGFVRDYQGLVLYAAR